MYEYLSTKQASERMGMPRRTVRALCRDGQLAGAFQARKGAPWRVPVDSVDDWIEQNKQTNEDHEPTVPKQEGVEDKSGAELPNTLFWKWVLAIGAVITILAGLAGLWADTGLREWVATQLTPISATSETPSKEKDSSPTDDGSLSGGRTFEGLLPETDPEVVIEKLEAFIDEGQSLTAEDDAAYERWRVHVETYLMSVFAKKPGTVQPHQSFEFNMAAWRGPEDNQDDLLPSLANALGVLDGILIGLKTGAIPKLESVDAPGSDGGLMSGGRTFEGLLPETDPEVVIEKLEAFIDEGQSLTAEDDAAYERWRSRVESYLKLVFAKKPGTVQPHESFEFNMAAWRGPEDNQDDLLLSLASALGVLDGIIDSVEERYMHSDRS